jgi:hypothetical protein
MYLKKNKLYFFEVTKVGRWLVIFLLLQWLVFVGMSSVFFGVWLENNWFFSYLNHPNEIKYISLIAYVLMVFTLYFFPQVIYLNVDQFKRNLNPQDADWWKMDQTLNAIYIFYNCLYHNQSTTLEFSKFIIEKIGEGKNGKWRGFTFNHNNKEESDEDENTKTALDF